MATISRSILDPATTGISAMTTDSFMVLFRLMQISFFEVYSSKNVSINSYVALFWFLLKCSLTRYETATYTSDPYFGFMLSTRLLVSFRWHSLIKMMRLSSKSLVYVSYSYFLHGQRQDGVARIERVSDIVV